MAMDAAVAVKSGGGGAGSTGVTAAASQSPQAATNGGERRSRFQRICVYCGSAKGRKPSYQDAAVELGKELVRHGTLLPHLKNPAFTFTVQQTNKKNPIFSGVNRRRAVWSSQLPGRQHHIKIPRASVAAILLASLHPTAPLRPWRTPRVLG